MSENPKHAPPEALVQIGRLRQETSQEQRESRRSSVEIRKVRGFMKQKFPLSETGEVLKKELQVALESGDEALVEELSQQVPTVENPREDLFSDLEFEPGERNDLFGVDLINIQTSKGCTRGCSHCAAGAESRVECMPFAAVAKIAEQRRAFGAEAHAAWKEWREELEDLYAEEKDKDLAGEQEETKEVKEARVRRVKERSRERFSSSSLGEFVAQENFDHLLGKDVPYPTRHLAVTTNYYDSEPFDYRDTTILHEDGTPAHYGDVFEQLATEEVPVHITTAGWAKNDKVAQRAAEKIARLTKENPRLLDSSRISVNPYTRLARSRPREYLEEMKNVIDTLAEANPEVLLFYERGVDADYEFWILVVRHLRDYVKQKYPDMKISQGGISSYSGAAAEQGQVEEDHDVMACMPGVHIWPDGTIARQGFDLEAQDQLVMEGVPKGSRPTPTGERLW